MNTFLNRNPCLLAATDKTGWKLRRDRDNKIKEERQKKTEGRWGALGLCTMN